MNALMFLAIRAAHVGVAAIWIGSSVFTSVLLMPSLENSGPSGGQVLASVTRRGLHAYMMVVSASTIATGLFLLWHFTGGFDANVVATHAGIAFAAGGAAGILAGAIGGGVVGRSSAALSRLVASAAGGADETDKAWLVTERVVLRRRIKLGSHLVLLLQATALMLMAVGHYV